MSYNVLCSHQTSDQRKTMSMQDISKYPMLEYSLVSKVIFYKILWKEDFVALKIQLERFLVPENARELPIRRSLSSQGQTIGLKICAGLWWRRC